MDSKIYMHGLALGAGLTSGCLVVLAVITAASKLFSWLMQML